MIDFGIARELASGQTQTHTNLVSEGYAPLEQYLPKARRSAASDVYGLAATLYSAVTGQMPVASVLRSHHPLTLPRQLNPRLSPGTEQAILQGMALELAQRPQSVATWLRLLSASGRRSQAPGPTTRPTQVVAPRMPSGYALDSDTQTNTPLDELPDELPDETFWPSRRRSPGGLRLIPSLFKAIPSLLFLGLLTGVGFVGYRLYLGAQQAMANLRERTAELPELPELSVPEVKFPEVTLPELTLPNLEEILADLPSTPTSESQPPAAPVPELPSPPVETNTPLILGSRGNPNTAAGGGGGVVPVPGFAPGTAATAVINRLGEPTRQSISPSATTAVYELDPNRATVAYRYDAAGNTVQQAEAVFAPSYDRLIMRVALTGMLYGQSTRAIEAGLDQVHSGQIDRYPFEQNGLTGSIERNNSGFIHMYVR